MIHVEKDESGKFPSITLSPDDIGEIGVYSEVTFVPRPVGVGPEDDARRMSLKHSRTFELRSVLTKEPNGPQANWNDPNSGGSHLHTLPKGSNLEFTTPFGKVHFEPNKDGELSLVIGRLQATSIHDAIFQFTRMLGPILDWLSYVKRIPLRAPMIIANDLEAAIMTFGMVSPPKPATMTPIDFKVHWELASVYALYREARNSDSPYYRLLCFYKILEGLLTRLRTDLRLRMREANIKVMEPKLLVPFHEDIGNYLRPHCGTPMKQFFDTFLQGEFRNVMAHFSLKGRDPINVSSYPDWVRFTKVGHLADLCARDAIAHHERLLDQFNEQEEQ